MIQVLRFIGVANAGVWFGAAIFVTFFAGPAFFSDAMLDALKHRYYAGLAAQIILGKYFLLHYICAFIALAHMLAEWLYLGRRQQRITIILWSVITGLVLVGGFYFQPRLHELHQAMYHSETPTEQAEATKAFRTRHGISQAANLIVTLSLLAFLWRMVTLPADVSRSGPYRKFIN